ncbi:uncharacterized protein L969DRAFT_97025 [Mixia osmundae IAM 14324]|uniref:Serine aminopeptidase S33 domain-containing protein n=1 Tax=Mixia osmundae (strain CBS 9802 / IAM 14324 / JCM 22182 / KY 12970) TaxID=764103 RepID=G7E1F9_MIXOS|nr:uncharacterized protein L969DRAFT_97025 [Mixia osmundae IAM 14324]KEI36623.1 hypothetical protein L969DRAFT_97025 [Mixia osmundae IAM 14324]GAA96669.1 hypothetical protein E5Q_03340 [Mixia osmundae IAM 14324]
MLVERVSAGTQLRTRLFRASELHLASQFAVIAHPLAAYGGDFDDPIVKLLTKCCLEQGIDVLTYNARGTPSSGLSATWTRQTEAKDFLALVQEMIDARGHLGRLHGFCIGYSAGAMSAALGHHAATQDVELSFCWIAMPVSLIWALCSFQTGWLYTSFDSVARHHRILVVFGTQDAFTSHSAYARWTGVLSRKATPASLTSWLTPFGAG